jgi:hypothetical protein
MSEEYVKRADECLRQAGACIADSNRAIFMDVAAKWRMLAKEVEAGAVPAPPATAGKGIDAKAADDNDVGKSLAVDRRTKAKTVSKPGQGDRGDRRD